MSMNRENKILFFVILFVSFFNFNLLVNAADCSKYGCATCTYSDDVNKLIYKVESDGTNVSLNFSTEKIAVDTSQFPPVYKFESIAVSENFITGDGKIKCPNKIYLETSSGASNGSKSVTHSSVVAAIEFKNKKKSTSNYTAYSYPSISLGKYENNKLKVYDENTKIGISCTIPDTTSLGIVTTCKLINDNLTCTAEHGYGVNYKTEEINASYFNKNGCVGLFARCGSYGDSKYCTVSTKNQDILNRDVSQSSETKNADSLGCDEGFKVGTDGTCSICASGYYKYDAQCVFNCPQGYSAKDGKVCTQIENMQVAEKPCEDVNIKTVLRFFGYLLMIAKYIIPLIIIGFGTFDLFKSVIDKDEKSLTKQIKQLGIRILAGLIVFFIPNIVSLFFSLSDTLNIIETDQYKTCSNCLLKPTTCEVTED